jgi:hypothetical protein
MAIADRECEESRRRDSAPRHSASLAVPQIRSRDVLSEVEPVRTTILGTTRPCVPRTRQLAVSYAICPPCRNRKVCSSRALCSFDTEVAYFLRIVFEKADIRDGIASYATVWAIMKVCILSSMDLRWRLHDRDMKLTRKWSICRPIRQVQGGCSGHARPVHKNVISSRQYRVLVLAPTYHVDRLCFCIDLKSHREIPYSFRGSSGGPLSRRIADGRKPHQ